jgi:succinylglutamate desuccinylase
VEYLPPEGAAYRVLNIGGVHGDETAGVEAVYRMMLECRKEPPSAVGMDFILCANPWGYRRDRRENRERIDLNRDFRDLASQEARIIDAYLKGRTYDLVVDHHENRYADGCSIIAHDESVRPALAAIIEELPQYAIAKKLPKVDDYAKGITIIHPGAGKAFSQYAAIKLCGPKRSFVIETPTSWELEKRVRCQLDLERKLEAITLRPAVRP